MQFNKRFCWASWNCGGEKKSGEEDLSKISHSCVPVVSHRSHSQEKGLVLVLGQGDVGQLGLGEDVLERKKPALVTLPEGILQAVAGGMHTVCLSDTGNVWLLQISYQRDLRIEPFLFEAMLNVFVFAASPLQIYTFGCNDEGALGRDTSEEGSEMVPGKVELAEKVVQVSAGDSHTAALSEDGAVFVWGSFRVSQLLNSGCSLGVSFVVGVPGSILGDLDILRFHKFKRTLSSLVYKA